MAGAATTSPGNTKANGPKSALKKNPYDTPAMRQFTRFKAEQPGCVLFFRMGDFYEMFGDDAVEMSRVLGLTLSERPKGVPLAGVPHHQLHNYLKRAVDAGYRVAVCDQIQDPKDAKGVVERAVTRVVTAGTLVDEGLLGEDAATVAAVSPFDTPSKSSQGRRWAGAAVDLSTGSFTVFDCPWDALGEHLTRLAAREACYPEGVIDEADLDELLEDGRVALTPRAAWQFREDEAHPALCKHFGVKTLEGFGLADTDAAIPAAGALLAYLIETQSVGADDQSPNTGDKWAASGGEFQGQRRTLAHLRPPAREPESDHCRLDAVSLRALEVVRTIRSDAARTDAKNDAAGSLLGVFTGHANLLATPMGKRLIREWLCRPLASADAILDRQSRVAALVEDRTASQHLADALHRCPDLARIAGRVALGRATPRDLVALADGLERLPRVADATDNTPAFADLRTRLTQLADALTPLAASIRESCVDEAPATLAKGGLIRDGVDAELDEARSLQKDAGAWLATYQAELNEQHDLPSLKVGYNKVFGYYIELPAAQARRAPAEFTRKQTLKNAERYITPELKEFEDKVTTAEDRALARERAIFADLLVKASTAVEQTGRYADLLAEIDTLNALAGKAAHRGWTRPSITADPVIDIAAGRHPVLDELLGDRFVPNDTRLGRRAEDSPGLALITGPNMAGKSTYIRQTALLVLLASIGSYIPADAATIGACDRIFTRVGADDALHRGPFDLHGRDDRDRRDPQQRHAPQPRHPRRDRARHLHPRRAQPRLGDRRIPRRR
jgi:DNA mismatch repair protein MutS